MNSVTNTSAAPTPTTERAAPSPVGWLRNEIDRLFDGFDLGMPGRSILNLPTAVGAVRPTADLVDEGEAYRLSVELPGLKQEDIDIQYQEGTLTISGEKKEEGERTENGVIVSERRYGSFRRQMSLPSDVDTDAIKAEYKDGVLTLTLRKNQDAGVKPRKIEISQT